MLLLKLYNNSNLKNLKLLTGNINKYTVRSTVYAYIAKCSAH